jgi:hypothetical protein
MRYNLVMKSERMMEQAQQSAAVVAAITKPVEDIQPAQECEEMDAERWDGMD